MMEQWMVMMINQKIGSVSDDNEMQELLHEAEQKKKAIQELSGNLQNVHAKIQQYQLQKRKEALEKKKVQRERLVRAKRTNDGIKASGILGRVDLI
jgi:predicted  nucleic acid-binding Zn-ribbon protein